LQNDIHKLHDLVNQWLFKLNADKCCGMTYTAITSNLSNTKYFIENSNKRYELVKVDSVSNLGVRIDSKLAFLDHMNEKVNKVCSMLGIIKINVIYLDKHSCFIVYGYGHTASRIRKHCMVPI